MDTKAAGIQMILGAAEILEQHRDESPAERQFSEEETGIFTVPRNIISMLQASCVQFLTACMQFLRLQILHLER